MRPRAHHAWATLAIATLTWELTCPRGELLTDAAHQAHHTHPWATRATIITTAAHLLGWLPHWADPWHQLARLRTPR